MFYDKNKIKSQIAPLSLIDYSTKFFSNKVQGYQIRNGFEFFMPSLNLRYFLKYQSVKY